MSKRTKWIASLALALILLFALIPGRTLAADIVQSGICGKDANNLTWTLDSDGVLTISGEGEMKNYSSEYSLRSPWYGSSSVKTVIVEPGVTSIGEYAFTQCEKLTNVSLPKGLISIGFAAFSECSDLSKINIPNTVTSIGGCAFHYCYDLTSIKIPDSVTSLGREAFEDCSSLTSITLSKRITTIAYLTFSGCRSLTSITIPDGVTSIEQSAFRYCKSLTSIMIPDNVIWISWSTFKGCSSLTSVYIPESITSIDERAFESCTALTDVYYSGSSDAWNQIKIYSYNDPLYAAVIHYNSDGPAAVPGDIASFTVTPSSGGKITLSWSASENAKTYVLQRHERGSSVWTTLSGSISGTTYTDTKGEAGKIYQYRVRGRNDKEFGNWKTSAEVACMSGSEPGSVGNPTVKALAGGKITVSWQAAEGAATYILQRNERGSSTWTTLGSNIKETSYTDSSAKMGKVYRYRVRSRNVSAFGPFKVSVEVASMSGSAPGAVSGVTVSAAAKQITVSWNAAQDTATYILQRKERGTDKWVTLNSNVKECSYVDTTGEVGAVYQYRVRSRNVSVYGPFKASTEVAFMKGSTPGDISKVTVKATSGKITVTWTASSGAAGYIVQRRVKGGSWENLSTNMTELKYVDKTVKAGTVYQYRIRPRNGNIYGNFKAGAEVTAQ